MPPSRSSHSALQRYLHKFLATSFETKIGNEKLHTRDMFRYLYTVIIYGASIYIVATVIIRVVSRDIFDGQVTLGNRRVALGGCVAVALLS